METKTKKHSYKTMYNEQLKQCQEQLERYNELETKQKYLLADFDNYKRNKDKQLDDFKKYQYEALLKDIISLKEEFNRIEDENLKTIYTNLFNKILNKYECREFNQVELLEFDPDMMEAVCMVPNEKEDLNGAVSTVVENGYYYKDKIIKYAKVTVYS